MSADIHTGTVVRISQLEDRHSPDDQQKSLIQPVPTQQDVVDALQLVMESVDKSSSPTKPEKYAPEFDKVVLQLAPIIHQSNSLGSAVWGSLKVFLQVPNLRAHPALPFN